MFTFRLNSYRIFKYLLILFFVSSEVIAGQTPKKCAGFNEYCLNHWDCCSNSCMSYLYRCTRGYNVYPYPFLGVSYKPTVTLDQILEQNFGSPNSLRSHQPKPYFVSRFGSTDDTETTEVQIVLKNSEETTSESSTLKTADIAQENDAILENRLAEVLFSTEKQNNDETTEVTVSSSTAILENRLAEVLFSTEKQNKDETTEVTVSSSIAKPACSEIGVKCYTNDECCTKRCHGFLHQCVT